MGVQIFGKDVSVISSIINKAKANISNVVGVVGWSGGVDVIPNPTPDWTDISGASPGQTNTQTISGINTSIILRIESDYNGFGQFRIFINDVGYNLDTDIETNGFSDQTVNNGDVVYFSRSSAGNVSETVTVKNNSDNNTVLDTFSITLTGGEV